MDPVSLAIGSAVVGGTTQAIGHVMTGYERARSQAFEAEEAARRSEEFRIAGAQAETRRREQLTSSLETVLAIRAGRGVGEGSPTALASMGGIIEDESRDVRAERLNYLTRGEQQRMASGMLRRQARMSLLSGYLSAVGDVAGTGFKIGTARLPSTRTGT